MNFIQVIMINIFIVFFVNFGFAQSNNTQDIYSNILKINSRYEEQTTPYYAASRLWVDAIIDPIKTREWISKGIEMADNAPVERFNVGVIQT